MLAECLCCIVCATGFLSTGTTVVSGAWSGNTAVPNVILPSWGIKCTPQHAPEHPTSLSLAFLSIVCTHPLGLQEPTSSEA